MIAEVDAGMELKISQPDNDCADGSGNIDFIEFLNMMARKLTGMKPAEQVKEAFDMLDTTGTGSIPLSNLYMVNTAITLELCTHGFFM